MSLFKTKQLPRLDRLQIMVSLVLRFSLLVALAVAILETQWTVAFVSAVAFVVTMLPWYFHRTGRLSIPTRFEFVLVLFVYSALYLGEVHGFYEHFWWWDVVLHAGSGAALGFVGFLILFILHSEEKFQANPSLIAFLSFSVAIAIGVIWEIFEFAMDNAFGLTMQKTGLVDTMWDLIVNTVGAGVAAVSGYLFLKNKRTESGLFWYYLSSYVAPVGKGEKTDGGR